MVNGNSEIKNIEKEVKREEKSIESRLSEIEKGYKYSIILNIMLIVLVVVSIFYTYYGIKSLYAGVPSQPVNVTATKTGQTPTQVNDSFGSRLTNIDAPFSAQELAAINDAPNSYFEQAGEMVLNTSPGNPFGETLSNNAITGPIFVQPAKQISPFILNGKPSVIYLGATSCVFCAENRWAMALALSRFGNFSKLFIGYSSFGDGDVPTVYWNKDNYTVSAGATFGNYYSSKYINFISADYDSPIVQGFQFPQSGVSYFIAAAPNSTYKQAYSLVNSTGLFAGTPFSLWGSSVEGGADAVVFGTSQPGQPTSLPPISYMTHSQILAQFASFNTTFAKEEYGAADVYVAELCPSIKNAAPACQLPAIQKMESIMGLNTTVA
ncbi:MAG: DUF929 family protein [Candidatus Micrarchaeia archaeon]